jgi:Ca2+-binding RTX toxin-like protein
VDASTLEGALTADLTAASDAQDITVTGSAQDDSFTTGALDDDDSIDGGEGTDSVTTSGAVDGVTLTSIEDVTVEDAGVVDVDLENASAVATVTMTQSGEFTNDIDVTNAADGFELVLDTNTDSTLGVDGTMTTPDAGSGELVLSTVGNGQITLLSDEQNANGTAIDIGEVTKLTFNVGNGGLAVDGTQASDVLLESTDNSLTGLIFAGAGAADLTGVNNVVELSGSDALDTIDAGALEGGLTMAAENVEVGTNDLTTDMTVTGGAGNDTLFGADGDDTIDAGGGNNAGITGDAGDDVITAGDGNDTGVDGGAGDDTINLGNGNNVVDGGADDDEITTGSGNDEITGGTGADTLTGGAGNDQFVYEAAADSNTTDTDTITDFDDAGDDTLEFDADAGALFSAAISNNALNLITGSANNTASTQTSAIAARFGVDGIFGTFSDAAAFVAGLTGITTGVDDGSTYVAFAVNTAGTKLFVAEASETGGGGSDIDSASIVMELNVENVAASDLFIF